MKKIKFVLLLLLVSSSSFATLLDALKPANIGRRIREEIASLDVNHTQELFNLNISEGIGISSRYRYEVEPSYKAKYHTRIDRWIVNSKISPGDLLRGDSQVPVFLNIAKNSEVIFVRQFKSKKKALLSLPIPFYKMPLTAKSASQNLSPGDFVSIPANLSVSISAGTSTAFLFPYFPIQAGASAHYIMSGKFLIHIFRMKYNRVRVKLIAQKNIGSGSTGNISANLQLFGVSVLDNQINRFMDLHFVSLGRSKGKGAQFIIDYVFDLNDEKAREAYNNILSSNFQFHDVSILTENMSGNTIAERLISSYELADEVFTEDKDKKNKRVNRLFKGINRYSQKSRSLKLGLVVATYNTGSSFTSNNVSHVNKEGIDKRYYYPVYSRFKDSRLRLWPFSLKEKITSSLFGLVPLDQNEEGINFSDFGYTYDITDKLFTNVEQKRFRQRVKDNISRDLYEQINWDVFNSTERKRNAVGYFQVIFKGKAFKSIEGKSYESIYKSLFKFYKYRKLIALGKAESVIKKFWNTISIVKIAEKIALKNIATKIHTVLSTKGMSGKRRISKLMELRKYNMFRTFGVGLLVSLLDKESLEENLYVSLKLHADDTEQVFVNFGDHAYSKLYRDLQYAYNSINNRSWDMRLISEEEKAKQTKLLEEKLLGVN